MQRIIKNCYRWLFSKLNIIGRLTAENVALRQQLIVLKRNHKRPVLKVRGRLFWVLLSRIWTGWRDVVYVVQPDTVIRWHKRAFKFYWRRKSERGKHGRPSLDPEFRAIVLKMAEANPLWGAPTIHGELLKLGIDISQRTVSKLIRQRTPKPPLKLGALSLRIIWLRWSPWIFLWCRRFDFVCCTCLSS